MRSFVAITVLLTLAMSTLVSAGTRTVLPTTTLGAETGNNTSSSGTFASQSNGNIGQANISKMSIRALLYFGSNTPIYAHFMPWFGGADHMDVGYASNDPAQIHRQVDDMLSRGIQGAIVDWYGPNLPREDQTTHYMRNEAQTRGGGFVFAVAYDGGALNKCQATLGCDLTTQAIADLIYAYNNYEVSPAYMRSAGRPVVFFFDPDRFGTLNWSQIAASVPGNPIFIFRNNGGFTHAASGGSFSWIGRNPSDPDDMGLSYFDSFYLTSLSYPQQLTFGSGNKGFNDSLAAWAPSPPRVQYQQCGQTWLSTLAESGRYFSPSQQLDAVQLVTWNDYEEGSEIETGIDNCVSVKASTYGDSLTWAVYGSVNTIDHFSVFISSDGVNLMWLADVVASVTSYDLGPVGMAPGNYTVFVNAVGKPSLTNKLSSGTSYTVSGVAPVTATTTENTTSYGVTVTSPLNGSTSGSPVHVVASASSSHPITYMHIYLDNISVYGAPVTGVDTYVSMGVGSHNVVVQAWDSTGAVFKTGVNLTVGAATTTTTTTTTTTPTTTAYGVNVTSPANGSISGSPVHIVASASSSHPITYMRIYLDNISVYGAPVTGVNTYVPMGLGWHNVVVQAWDGTGVVFKTGVKIQVQ